MDVSKNRDTSKWMVKIMKNPIKIHYLGGTIIFGKKTYKKTPKLFIFYFGPLPPVRPRWASSGYLFAGLEIWVWKSWWIIIPKMVWQKQWKTMRCSQGDWKKHFPSFQFKKNHPWDMDPSWGWVGWLCGMFCLFVLAKREPGDGAKQLEEISTWSRNGLCLLVCNWAVSVDGYFPKQ